MRHYDADLTLEDHPERRFEGNPILPAPLGGTECRLESLLHEISLLVGGEVAIFSDKPLDNRFMLRDPLGGKLKVHTRIS